MLTYLKHAFLAFSLISTPLLFAQDGTPIPLSGLWKVSGKHWTKKDSLKLIANVNACGDRILAG